MNQREFPMVNFPHSKLMRDKTDFTIKLWQKLCICYTIFEIFEQARVQPQKKFSSMSTCISHCDEIMRTFARQLISFYSESVPNGLTVDELCSKVDHLDHTSTHTLLPNDDESDNGNHPYEANDFYEYQFNQIKSQLCTTYFTLWEKVLTDQQGVSMDIMLFEFRRRLHNRVRRQKQTRDLNQIWFPVEWLCFVTFGLTPENQKMLRSTHANLKNLIDLNARPPFPMNTRKESPELFEDPYQSEERKKRGRPRKQHPSENFLDDSFEDPPFPRTQVLQVTYRSDYNSESRPPPALPTISSQTSSSFPPFPLSGSQLTIGMISSTYNGLNPSYNQPFPTVANPSATGKPFPSALPPSGLSSSDPASAMNSSNINNPTATSPNETTPIGPPPINGISSIRIQEFPPINFANNSLPRLLTKKSFKLWQRLCVSYTMIEYFRFKQASYTYVDKADYLQKSYRYYAKKLIQNYSNEIPYGLTADQLCQVHYETPTNKPNPASSTAFNPPVRKSFGALTYLNGHQIYRMWTDITPKINHLCNRAWNEILPLIASYDTSNATCHNAVLSLFRKRLWELQFVIQPVGMDGDDDEEGSSRPVVPVPPHRVRNPDFTFPFRYLTRFFFHCSHTRKRSHMIQTGSQWNG
jgi:hypothetical protein